MIFKWKIDSLCWFFSFCHSMFVSQWLLSSISAWFRNGKKGNGLKQMENPLCVQMDCINIEKSKSTYIEDIHKFVIEWCCQYFFLCRNGVFSPSVRKSKHFIFMWKSLVILFSNLVLFKHIDWYVWLYRKHKYPLWIYHFISKK